MIARMLMAATALCCASQAGAEHLHPRDECGATEGVDSFRMGLVTAVANRDAEMLRPLVSEQVHLDFGGGTGWETLKQRLTERDLWSELDKVLRLGCARSYEQSIAMPWVWEQDFGIEDPFSAWLALGEDVPLLAEGRPGAELIRRLNWEAVEQIGGWQGDEEFIRVRTKSGEEGFAPTAQLRHQLDYRLIAEPVDGRWQVTVFIAGD